jgi:hypothetical protein
MDGEIIVHPEDGYLEIITGGHAGGDGSLEMARVITETMRKLRINRALIDHRKGTGVSGGVADVYCRPRALRIIGYLFRVRIAESIMPERVKHFRFFETECKNQGFLLSIFREREKAVEWLLG